MSVRYDAKQQARLTAYIARRRSEGMSYGDISNELKTLGTPLSLAACQRYMQTRPEGELQKVSTPRPLPDTDPEEEPEELNARLVADLAHLRTMSAQARDDGNITGFANLQRVINTTMALIAKTSPPPQIDAAENPDMVAAAEKCIAMLWRAVRADRSG